MTDLDFLISNRITITQDKVIVKYYTIEEVKKEFNLIKRMFVDTISITNSKNKDLFLEAAKIANDKKLKPLMSPLIYSSC